MLAAALEYRQGMNAPVLKAFGEGAQAKKIVEMAAQHGIEIKEGESTELLQVLKNVHVNDEIPVELYAAVAAIYIEIIKGSSSEVVKSRQAEQL